MNKTIKRLRILFFLMIATAISSSLMAQKATLKGVIRDGISNEELIGATVMVVEVNLGEVTDIDGKYRINSIPQGTYHVAISYLGYQPDTLLLTLTAGQVLEQNVLLNYETITTVEVVVSAQAEGQMSSINQQLADNTIKNIISAKKIQETPNANAAEAIGRVSGVSIVRSGGEGNKVVVRGLAPKFNKVQVEGISMASTGGDNRSSDLSMISPYMLDGIEVSKAAMANQEGDVIGGTVNFILRQAPDSMTFDAILQGGYSSLNSSFNNYKLVVGGSNRFFNGKLGVFAQIDLERRDRSSNEVDVSYKNPTNQLDSFDVFLGAMSVRDIQRDIKRGGATVVMDYQLASGDLKMSNFVSLINNDQINRYELYNPAFSTHTYGLALTEDNVRVMTNALKYKTTFGAWTFDAGVSFSQSKNKRPSNTNFFATEPNAFNGQIAFVNDPTKIQTFAKNEANNANVQFINKSLFKTNEDKYGADINLTYDVNFFKNLNVKFKAGLKYKLLKKDFDQESARIPVAQSGHGGAFVKEAIKTISWLNENLASDASKLPYDLFVDNDYGKNDFPEGVYSTQNIPDINKINDFARLA
ncbi:MAG TPA: TonB-dependent receptor, partial [Phaeodactylibacter sp.]|nr:TonB-dependent receptor [Phaeodactylibacter sp.]